MPFVPDDFEPPRRLETELFVLEPLGPQHNEADYAAWTSSMDHIRSTPGLEDWDWPHEMPLEENLGDLERHAKDFEDRTGFTFTVLDPADGDVIGCLYLYPALDEVHDVQSRSWVRASKAALDARLWEAVTAWMASDWPWSNPLYARRLEGIAGAEDEVVRQARAIAETAHVGQVDKAGEPYIGHPRRVAARLSSPRQKAVAWLHDVIEDTGWTAEALIADGVPEDVVRSVVRLSRRDDQTYEDFVRSIAASDDPIAIAVKRADIADNLDETRMARLDPTKAARLRAKYASALAILGDG